MACLSRMLGNGHVLVLRGARRREAPGLPDTPTLNSTDHGRCDSRPALTVATSGELSSLTVAMRPLVLDHLGTLPGGGATVVLDQELLADRRDRR